MEKSDFEAHFGRKNETKKRKKSVNNALAGTLAKTFTASPPNEIKRAIGIE